MSDLEWILVAIVASAARRSTGRWPRAGAHERSRLGTAMVKVEWWLLHPDFDPGSVEPMS